MDGVTHDVEKVAWWRDVVGQSTNWRRVTSEVILLPLAKEADEVVASKLAVKNLREEIEVRHESSLKNDWNIRGVEQLNWVRLLVSAHLA